jgi:hypothetical protein
MSAIGPFLNYSFSDNTTNQQRVKSVTWVLLGSLGFTWESWRNDVKMINDEWPWCAIDKILMFSCQRLRVMKNALHYVVGWLLEQQIPFPTNGCQIMRIVGKGFESGSLKPAMLIKAGLMLHSILDKSMHNFSEDLSCGPSRQERDLQCSDLRCESRTST